MISLTGFKRTTSNKHYILEIDGLRFFSIITVVLFHLNTAVAKFSGLGLEAALIQMGGPKTDFTLSWWWIRLDLGVKVFFAISGFVLALPFLKYYLGLTDKKVRIKEYFIRRLIRLEPPFILTLLLFYIVHIVFMHASALDLVKNFLIGLFYSHVLFMGEPNPINPVTWSLETEAQFYCLVPFILGLIFIFKKRIFSISLLVILIGISIVFKHYFYYNAFIGSTIASYFANFAMGIIACWLYLKKTTWFTLRSWQFDFLGLIATLGLFYFYKPQNEYINQIGFNISIFLVVITAFKGKALNYIYTRPAIYVVGGMCYSIYLIHYAFFHFSVPFTMKLWIDSISYNWNLIFQIAINLPLVLLISMIFFKYVEKPFMNINRD